MTLQNCDVGFHCVSDKLEVIFNRFLILISHSESGGKKKEIKKTKLRKFMLSVLIARCVMGSSQHSLVYNTVLFSNRSKLVMDGDDIIIAIRETGQQRTWLTAVNRRPCPELRSRGGGGGGETWGGEK